jgi:small subunit ribosomal protein S9
MADAKSAPKSLYLGTGRRKTSVAQIRLTEGTGQISINGRGLEDYFSEDKDRAAVVGPLVITEMRNRLDLAVKVHGGGITGQAGAICQGVARALKNMFAPYDPSPPPPPPAPALDGTPAPVPEPTAAFGIIKKLRDSGYLSRDDRMKERKKYGRKGARRSFQFSKR